jgi:serine/threonine protein kinase
MVKASPIFKGVEQGFVVRIAAKDLEERLQFSRNIGSGSFSNVYRAVWDGKRVAVKVLLPELNVEDDAQLYNFFKEAELLHKLKHR